MLSDADVSAHMRKLTHVPGKIPVRTDLEVCVLPRDGMYRRARTATVTCAHLPMTYARYTRPIAEASSTRESLLALVENSIRGYPVIH